jgi:hypothetical protein
MKSAPWLQPVLDGLAKPVEIWRDASGLYTLDQLNGGSPIRWHDPFRSDHLDVGGDTDYLPFSIGKESDGWRIVFLARDHPQHSLNGSARRTVASSGDSGGRWRPHRLFSTEVA